MYKEKMSNLAVKLYDNCSNNNNLKIMKEAMHPLTVFIFMSKNDI